MRYLNLQSKADTKNYFYKIADSYYQSDTLINELEFLIQAHFHFDNHQNISNNSTAIFSNIGTIFNDLTLIGENTYPLHVSINSKSGYQLKVNDNTYYVDKKSITADLDNIDITVLMGPVFILHLAKNKVFCLHASAFIIKQTCFILMADSGTGKSTIARHMQQMHIGQRVADDIVPIKINNGKITLLPSFPQLKLTQEEQHQGDDICQKTVLLFAQKSNNKTSLNRIDKFISIKKLIKHSVATKLFSTNELRNHLLFCHHASEQTKAYQLDYQHSKTSLLELTDLLNEMA